MQSKNSEPFNSISLSNSAEFSGSIYYLVELLASTVHNTIHDFDSRQGSNT